MVIPDPNRNQIVHFGLFRCSRASPWSIVASIMRRSHRSAPGRVTWKAFGRIPLALAALALAAAPSSGQPAERPPNIIVILLDDAGWRDLGFTGNGFVETPHMDRLAGTGMRFTQGYATHTFCAPTRQSMVTGQYPARTSWARADEVAGREATGVEHPALPAVSEKWTRQELRFQSLAERLREKDYATAHVGKWHFRVPFGNELAPEDVGFDLNFAGDARIGELSDFTYPFERLEHLDIEGEPGDHMTDLCTQRAIRFIRENRERPFFVQLWYYAPHLPLEAPEALVDKYRQKAEALGDDSLNPTYAAMIDYLDQGVGRVVDALEDLGLRDDTVIFIASDNGALAR